MADAVFAGSRDELAAMIRLLPQIVAGQAPDPLGIARRIQLRVGVALLSQVQQDFLRKSRGETGRDGIKWEPLKRATIAQRRTTGAELKRLGITGKRVRGLLTPAEDKRWREIFGRTLARLREDGFPESAAKTRAGQAAWTVLKAEGAQTKLEVLGGRKVDILRDTGELFRSLSPGVEDQPSNADGQIFQVPTGRVIVGTNKKPWHHKGIPGRLPARPFWPPDGSIPEAWWPPIQRAAMRGLQAVVAELLAAGRNGGMS